MGYPSQKAPSDRATRIKGDQIKETCEADPHRSCGLLVIGDITRFVEHAPLQIIDHHKADHGSRDRT